jgi:hypothetical protein
MKKMKYKLCVLKLAKQTGKFCAAELVLHIENQLCIMPGSALKVCVGGGWVVVVVNSEFSDRFGLALALAKPNKMPLTLIFNAAMDQFIHLRKFLGQR